MKISKIIYGFVFITCALAFVTSCEEDDEALFPPLSDVSPLNIAELTAEDSELSALSAALLQSDVDAILRETTTYTVFAPQNGAFDGVDVSAMTEFELNNLLLNHVVSTTTADFVASLTTGYLTTMSVGPDENPLNIFVDTANGLVLNGVGASVDGKTDIGATNGIIHVIDGLLVPPTVVDHAIANPDYSSFAAAIDIADMAESLDGAGPFTIFAPNNSAFEAFMTMVNGAFGWTTLDDIPTDVLQQVVMYHVITGANTLSSDLTGDQTTMQGELFTITDGVIDDTSYTNGNTNLNDIQAVNGIIQGVDKVLLPDAVFQSVLSANLNLVERAEDKGYSLFLQAVEMAGLTESFSSDELTAFLPSNDAFALFFIGLDNFGSLEDFDSDADLEILKQLIEYHLYSGTLLSSELTDGESLTTIQGDAIVIDLSGENARLIPSYADAQKAEIESANIGASNGVMHQLNKVLIPDALAAALGVKGAGGLQPVAENALLYFDFNGTGTYDSWWGDVADSVIDDAATSSDGTPYFDSKGTQGTGWTGLFFRNGGNNFTPAAIGTAIDNYEFKFDINVKSLTTGNIRFRFEGSIGDVFYDWDVSQVESPGWITIVLPASLLGVSDFSLVDNEFGAAYSGDSILDFSIDNIRFEEVVPAVEPVADDALVYFDFNAGSSYGSWWGDIGDPVADAANSADGTQFMQASGVQGSGWTGLFFRNGGDNFTPTAIGTDISNYSFKFDINVIESFTDGTIRFRFEGAIGDIFYDWDATQIEGGSGWQTVTIPASSIGVSDFSQVDNEFGAAYSGTSMLNFAIDNLRFEAN